MRVVVVTVSKTSQLNTSAFLHLLTELYEGKQAADVTVLRTTETRAQVNLSKPN